MKSGAEQLPGRGGSGSDFLHLPMSFRDFCMQVEGIPLPAETTDIEGFLEAKGRKRPDCDRVSFTTVLTGR